MRCDSVLTLRSINLINLHKAQLNVRLQLWVILMDSVDDLKISCVLISITLLALSCCCESQSSPVRNIRGPITKLHAASVASSSFALVYEPGI